MVGYRKQGFGAGSQSVVRAADRKPGKCRNSRGLRQHGAILLAHRIEIKGLPDRESVGCHDLRGEGVGKATLSRKAARWRLITASLTEARWRDA